jgi:hypothetical protein
MSDYNYTMADLEADIQKVDPAQYTLAMVLGWTRLAHTMGMTIGGARAIEVLDRILGKINNG